MSNELQSAMPDPNSNVQLPEGSVPPASLLGGEVATQFTFGRPEDYAASVEAARVEQEAMCGYALQVKALRQTHMQDEKGRDVYEVFATFGPVPPPAAVPKDATQV